MHLSVIKTGEIPIPTALGKKEYSVLLFGKPEFKPLVHSGAHKKACTA